MDADFPISFAAEHFLAIGLRRNSSKGRLRSERRIPASGLVICVGMLFLLAIESRTQAQIRQREQILFFPTAARLNHTGQSWLVPIHGWIYEPDGNPIVRRVAIHRLAREMELDDDTGARRTLSQRAGWLLTDNKHRKRVEIAIGEQRYSLTPSSADGHFVDTLELPLDVVASLAVDDQLPFRALLPEGDERSFSGTVTMVSRTGVTVISDIDDTVKVTEVTQRTRLLRRTFVEPFEAVTGMSKQYQAWHARGALIWYVSAGPWQLFAPIREYLAEESFPPAVWTMRRSILTDPGERELFDEPYEYKVAQLAAILEAFPDRRFILIGDSGETDPEAYAEIARRFPDQIVNIAIRDVTRQSASADRYHSAFRDVPPSHWQVFDDPTEIAVPAIE